MDEKLELVNSIENIKEKITSQEYKELLENLAKIKVVETSKLHYNSDDSDDEKRRLERIERERIRLEQMPEEQLRIWTGTEVVELSSRDPKIANDQFARPTRISTELAVFLQIPEGVLISRPIVIRCLTNYINEHNLQNPEIKRVVDLTKPGGQQLKELLKVPDNQELTFFNMQKYLNPHWHPLV
jgi:chromatin remodeling complex protein RSC6